MNATIRPHPLLGRLPELQDALIAHYKALSDASRRLRFLTPAADDAYLEKIGHRIAPDHVIEITLEGETAGILEIYTGRDGHAEIGISMEDRFQGRGLGGQLFAAGLDACAQMGVTSADLYFSSANTAIMHMCQERGAHIEREGSDVMAYIDLSNEMARAA
ncbi:hypothetical protein PSA7680_01792 [Pseudoruegeria aquimaris]|uniref:N-acetyltransferase domain-containing protein n=1 Tax=Pseudoruegeria aquimaris TaxID=393663 RepID=A0A1Y5SCL7_9RHOB|nr:GNAT family N-acetyltransferase [Pseudoruegeria aquimaris]SLN36942.1 hypothetical protein PSA7680_01792 [Pseudoruegeria aquimaris]